MIGGVWALHVQLHLWYHYAGHWSRIQLVGVKGSTDGPEIASQSKALRLCLGPGLFIDSRPIWAYRLVRQHNWLGMMHLLAFSV